jgi:GntR family transcriptional repressor for pyruvate dehydrogenase complex
METPNFTPLTIDRKRLHEQVADRLIKYILQEKLPTGTRLPSERSLSEQFGVSRVVIRESMKVLVGYGLIVIEPGKGTFMSDGISGSLLRLLDLHRRIEDLDSDKLWEVRSPLEIAVARLAAMRADPQEIEILETCTGDMERYINDVELHRAANEKFHLALASATKNELFVFLLQPLVQLTKETRILMAKEPMAAKAAVQSHRRLVAAIKQHNPDKAEQEMRLHMEEGARFLSLVVATGQKADEHSPS